MKKRLMIVILMTLTIFISGCSQGTTTEPTIDLVATQVVLWLTASATSAEQQQPTQTTTPLPINSPTTEEVPATPTATETTTPTSTASATPTQDLSDPAVQLGSPAWSQDFSGGTSPWDFEYPQAEFFTNNGYLNLIARENSNWHSWYVTSPKLRNAYLEAVIEMPNCSGLDRFGLAVRADSEGQQFYFLSITCDGRWGFFRMDEDVNINEILGFQPSDQLSDSMVNAHRVGIWMDGTSFKFYINGIEVGSATDDTLTGEGYTGFLIAYANTPGYTVKVDELSYWTLP